jgi:hypothetical protein
MPRLAVFALAIAVTFAGPAVAEPNREVIDKATALFSRDVEERGDAIVYFIERHDTDAIAALIFAHRFTSDPRAAAALTILTGETGPTTWFDWMLWQQEHPEIVPFHGFDGVHAAVHERIDPNFQLFLRAGNKHDIRIEEIVWGGVPKDGIPALTHPRLLEAGEADYLNDDDLVFGISIAGMWAFVIMCHPNRFCCVCVISHRLSLSHRFTPSHNRLC